VIPNKSYNAIEELNQSLKDGKSLSFISDSQQKLNATEEPFQKEV